MVTVSIILPNLNQERFLRERLSSIFAQTLVDWELIIVDGFSDDGSWEIIQSMIAGDSRCRAWQMQRGLYQSWNAAISEAKGEFVYIATSDDTMRETALARMVEALKSHPKCGICDSRLEIIDEQGRQVASAESGLFINRYYDLIGKDFAVRNAPHDFYIYALGRTVFTSLTQVLIRRSLFDVVGLFSTQFGSRADYEWGFRVSSVADVVYINERLATWRRHDSQVTSNMHQRMHYDTYRMARAACKFASNRSTRLSSSDLDRAESFLRGLAIADVVRCRLGLKESAPVLYRSGIDVLTLPKIARVAFGDRESALLGMIDPRSMKEMLL